MVYVIKSAYRGVGTRDTKISVVGTLEEVAAIEDDLESNGFRKIKSEEPMFDMTYKVQEYDEWVDYVRGWE